MQSQRASRGSRGGSGSTRRRTAAGVLVLLLTATGCGGGDDEGASAQSSPSNVAATVAGVVAPAKVEVIAGLTGCEAEIRVEAEELREGMCHTKKADYVITTFPHQKYQQTWLDAASVYGGTYLVGSRWVVSAEPETLGHLRAKLGGTVQQLS